MDITRLEVLLGGEVELEQLEPDAGRPFHLQQSQMSVILEDLARQLNARMGTRYLAAFLRLQWVPTARVPCCCWRGRTPSASWPTTSGPCAASV